MREHPPPLDTIAFPERIMSKSKSTSALSTSPPPPGDPPAVPPYPTEHDSDNFRHSGFFFPGNLGVFGVGIRQITRQGADSPRHSLWRIAVDISPTPPAETIDWPSYWLVSLERAVASGDYQAAALAQRELRRLGIDVTLRVLPRREGVKSHLFNETMTVTSDDLYTMGFVNFYD